MQNTKIFLTALIIFFSTFLYGQVTVNLNVDANPNPYISSWANQEELVIVTVTNTNPGMEGMNYKIRIKMELDGDLVAETNTAQVATRTLSFGSDVFLADEVIDYNALQIYGGYESQVAQTGMLPAGTYSFCVSLVDMNDVVISTPMEVCKPMFITSYQAPELIYPVEDAELQANTLQGASLTWSPISPNPPSQEGIKYIVTVSEVYPYQTPSEAFFNNLPVIEEEVIAGNQFLWPPEVGIPEDTIQYVWSVKAVNFDDQPYIPQNSGFASLSNFTVLPNMPLAGGGGQPEGVIAAADTIFAGQNGEFEVITTEVNTVNGKFSGKGTVFVGWLNAPIDVKFDTITVDTVNRLLSGKVLAEIHENAPAYPLAWMLQATGPPPMTNDHVIDIATFVENNTEQTVFFNNPSELTEPIKMPLGTIFPNGTEFAITEMAFLPDTAKFNSVTAMALPPNLMTERIGFRIKEVRFHPNNFETPPARIELVEDISIANLNGKIEFLFKTPDPNNLGCYIEFDEYGFSEYGLQITSLFTREWMLPSPDNDPNQRVSASLSAQGSSWTDLVLGGTMDKFEIPESDGMTLLADSIYYDFSININPPGIVFPENYPGDTTNIFRGFYMKTFEIELPQSWQTQAANPPKISAQNVIINHVGITLLAEATNVIQFPDATVAELVASIDTVHAEWIASYPVEAGIKGRIGLPVSKKDSIPNPLEYTAVFNNPSLPNEPVSFQLTVTPTGPIPAHLLKADMELAQTSNIVAYMDKNKTTFDMSLDGSLIWDTVTLAPIKDVTLGLDFEGLGMDYDSDKSPDNRFGFNIGSWAFASDQKLLADFPVTIDNIGFQSMPPQQNQLLRGKINIDVIFNLSEDIGGMTGLGVEMAMLDDVQGQKFYPEYQSTSIDSIAIQANMSAVNIEGAIGFRQEDPVFGNGFIGTISADFKPSGIQASALAEFGNTNYQNGNQLYRYWRVEADVTIPPPGAVFLPGLAFRGFGGGAYYNMEASLSGTTYSFTPLKSQLGFNAIAKLATSPDAKGFNADATLAGEFNANTKGLTFINFTGDFWVGAEMSSQSRAEAIVEGDLGVTYNFPDKHFNLFANVNVDAPPLSTPNPVGLVLDINGTTNQWYFKFGEPSNPNTVNVLGANLYTYLMFGNDIPFPSGFTPQFSNAYYNAVSQYPGAGSIGQGGVGSHTNTGSGFAAGLGFLFDHESEFGLPCGVCMGDFYAGVNLGAGAELHLALMNYSGGCAGNNPIGINGWRASGGLGFYATAGAYVRREGGLGDKTWTLADLAAGAWIYGEFPNPYYAAGAISGHAYVFKVIDVHFHREFEVGTACSNSPSGSSVSVTPGDVAADQQEKLVQYVKPTNTFNFPTDAPLAVKYGLEPDEVFDVAEQQADGTIKMRTFKMEQSVMLEAEQQNGTWSPEMLNQNSNTLGEYLYTTMQEATGIDPGYSPAGPGGVSGGPGGAGSTGNTPSNLGPSGGIIFNFMNDLQTLNVGAGTTGGGQSGGSGLGSGQAFNPLNMPLITYPAEPPAPDYGDLPPTPDPPVNGLEEDTNYKLTVTATLKEYQNGSWTDALTNGGDPVTETVVKNFSTGGITGVQLPAENY